MRASEVALVAVVLAGAACSSSNTTTPGSPAGPYVVAVFNGNGQAALPNAVLATPLSVAVADTQGAAAVGVQVTW